MNTDQLQRAEHNLENKRLDFDAELEVLQINAEFVNWARENNMENIKPPKGFWGFLKNPTFWLKFIEIAYKILVKIITKSS
jgi:hypothetical protein